MPGSVHAVSQATVRAKLSAEVKRVLVREGDRVTAGQSIAEFDTAQLRAQMAERKAALESSRAQLAMADRTRQANAQLRQTELHFAERVRYRRQRASGADLRRWRRLRRSWNLTQLSMTDAVVRAPISGTVSKRHVQPGEKVSFDAPLLSIVDLAQLEVQAQVPVSDVTQIRKGMPAQVDVEGIDARKFEGRVERINPERGARHAHDQYLCVARERGVLAEGRHVRARVADSFARNRSPCATAIGRAH